LKGRSAITLKGKAIKPEDLLGLLTLLGETAKTNLLFVFIFYTHLCGVSWQDCCVALM
jgi:hypothetical protein